MGGLLVSSYEVNITPVSDDGIRLASESVPTLAQRTMGGVARYKISS